MIPLKYPAPAYAYRLELGLRDILCGAGIFLCLVLTIGFADLFEAPAREVGLAQQLAASGYTFVLKDKIAACAQDL